jgi:hypothetical protein
METVDYTKPAGEAENTFTTKDTKEEHEEVVVKN